MVKRLPILVLALAALGATGAAETPVKGLRLTGDMNAGGHTITNLAPGVGRDDAATVGQINASNELGKAEIRDWASGVVNDAVAAEAAARTAGDAGIRDDYDAAIGDANDRIDFVEDMAATTQRDLRSADNRLTAALAQERIAREAGDTVALTNWHAVVYSMTNGAALGALKSQLLIDPNTNAVRISDGYVDMDGAFGIIGEVLPDAIQPRPGDLWHLDPAEHCYISPDRYWRLFPPGGDHLWAVRDPSGFASIQRPDLNDYFYSPLNNYWNLTFRFDPPVTNLLAVQQHNIHPDSHPVIRARIEVIEDWLAGANMWMVISNGVMTISRDTTNGTVAVWSSAESSGGDDLDELRAEIAELRQMLNSKADRQLSRYATGDGSANPDPSYMFLVNNPALMHASGLSWSSYGAYGLLTTSGMVAYDSGTNGTARWGVDATNYIGFVRGGNVIVGAHVNSLTIENGGSPDGIARMVFPYAGGDFPTLWFSPTLSPPMFEIIQDGVAWVDNQDGTATVSAPATTGRGFWYGSTSRQVDVVFEATPPAHLRGGVIGTTGALPVVYDSVISVPANGKTYRIPAQEVK